MYRILFVDVAFTARSDNLVVRCVEIPIPLVVFITLEKDEIHGKPPDVCCWPWDQV